MGCVSSKIITKSKSYREEYLMNQSQRMILRRKKDKPYNNCILDDDVLEELFISKNGGITLVSSANDNMGTKKGTTTFSYSDDQSSDEDIAKSSIFSSTNNDTIDSLELMSGLEEEDGQGEQHQLLSLPRSELETMPNSHNVISRKRSHSFHCVTEHNFAKHHQSSDRNNKNSDNKDMGILIKSKSFHFYTLQEYDKLVEREKLLDVLVERNKLLQEQEVPNSNLYPNDGGTCKSKITCHDCISKEDNAAEKDKSMLSIAEDPTPFVLEANKESTPRKGKVVLDVENGLRRKAMAKDLASLSITMPASLSAPNTEFPAAVVGMGRESLGDSKVAGKHQQIYNNYYSSEAYVTPKFGSFNSLPVPVYRVQRSKFSTGISTNTDDANIDNEESVFESEMVAAYEKAMEQFQVEEECVLKQITEENFEEIISNVSAF